MSDPFPNPLPHAPSRTVEWIERSISEQIDKRLEEIQEKISALQDTINKHELEKQELLAEKAKHERLFEGLAKIQSKIEEEVLNKTFNGEYLDTLKPFLIKYGVDVSSMNVENTYTTKSSYRDENEDNLKLEGEENYGRE